MADFQISSGELGSNLGFSSNKTLKIIVGIVIALVLIVVLIVGISYYSTITKNRAFKDISEPKKPMGVSNENLNNTHFTPINENISNSSLPVADNLTAFDFGNNSAASVPPIVLGNKAAEIHSNINNTLASNTPAFDPSVYSAASVPAFDFGNNSAASVPSNIK